MWKVEKQASRIKRIRREERNVKNIRISCDFLYLYWCKWELQIVVNSVCYCLRLYVCVSDKCNTQIKTGRANSTQNTNKKAIEKVQIYIFRCRIFM